MKGGVRGIDTETEDAEDEDRDESFRADDVDVKIRGVATAPGITTTVIMCGVIDGDNRVGVVRGMS